MTTTAVGSIPITGGTDNQPPEPTRPTMPDPSDEECELELQLERTREKKRKLKEEKKRAEEEAKRKAEEEKQRQEAAVRAANARKMEEEVAEKRRRIAAAAAARNRRGPSPGEATTSARRVEVEIPWVVRKGKTPQRHETSGGDPDDGDDGGNDEEERAPCKMFVFGLAGTGEEGRRPERRAVGGHGEPNGPAPRRQLGLEGVCLEVTSIPTAALASTG
ncbi:hypothetical protein EV359DRAFT_88271 [Lentinula novae-zelandiae]|nr:hypothetical protein EV359DRAFT_88271 [Lentinula novae-zelandiae]